MLAESSRYHRRLTALVTLRRPSALAATPIHAAGAGVPGLCNDARSDTGCARTPLSLCPITAGIQTACDHTCNRQSLSKHRRHMRCARLTELRPLRCRVLPSHDRVIAGFLRSTRLNI